MEYIILLKLSKGCLLSTLPSNGPELSEHGALALLLEEGMVYQFTQLKFLEILG